MARTSANATHLSDRMAIGCSIALALFIVTATTLAVMVYRWAEQAREESTQKWNEQQAKLFDKVSAGNDDGSGITIMMSGRVIETIAQDPDCVANLTTLRFSMVDLSEPQIASAKKLVNVRTIDFYSCSDAENLLAVMKGLPSIQVLRFDTTSLSEEGIRLLVSFPNLKRVHFAYIHQPSQAELLRKTLPGVTIDIDEVGSNEAPK